MRILVVTNMLPMPGRPWYGIFVQEQIADIQALGVDVRVELIDGASRPLAYARGAGSVRSALRGFHADIVHAHYGLTGAVALTQRRAPVVTTFHGSDCNGSIPWQRRVSWMVARACTPVFVSSELARGLGCAQAAVIPAAVDLDAFRPVDREQARAALGWEHTEPVALLPGSRSHRAKGADLFDAAVTETRRLLPGLHAVSLEGLSRQEVALTMNAADVTVLTSVSEGSPVAVRESLACTTPVVTVPVGDAPMIVEGLPGCAVVPRDPMRIAQAIEAALEMGRSSALRERVAPFGRPVIAQRLHALYQSVVSRGGRR